MSRLAGTLTLPATNSFFRSDRAFGGKGKPQDGKKMKVRDARAAIEEMEAEKVMQVGWHDMGGTSLTI